MPETIDSAGCPRCGERTIVGIEYAYGDREHYDGVSEWRCVTCGYRQGRWTGRELGEGDVELRFGGDSKGPTWD
jgi:Zn ribbon nucleic-acid-binding protein